MFTAFHRGGAGEPLLLLHGFTDTWRTWELVLPLLEPDFDVLAPTLPGHAGGAPLEGRSLLRLADEVERRVDEAGWAAPRIAGNSLGGWLALELASRGRAHSVVAFAPAGDRASADALPHFRTTYRVVRRGAPSAGQIASTADGRRRMTKDLTVRFEHIPAELLVHQLVGAAACDATLPLIDEVEAHGWPLDASRIDCPVRIVWGKEDRILPWPAAAERYRRELRSAELVALAGVGHLPQLDAPAATAELIRTFP